MMIEFIIFLILDLSYTPPGRSRYRIHYVGTYARRDGAVLALAVNSQTMEEPCHNLFGLASPVAVGH